MSPLVSVVIVNWNRREHTLACLRSLALADYPALDIVVVDNGSRDDSVAAIHAAHPHVHIIAERENTGFVNGCNRGSDHARTAGASYALFLNNDAEVAPDAIGQLVAAAATSQPIGAVGPTVYYDDRRDIIWSAGGRIDWQRGTTSMLGLDEVDRGQFGRAPRPVDFLTGCALMVPIAAIARVGGFDPRFFAYYEETEWCMRARRAGYIIRHVPRAAVWHKAPLSSRPASLLTHYYMTRNRLLFLAATNAPLAAWRHTLFEYLRTSASWTIRPKWQSRRRHRDVTVHAVVDFFRGRLGRCEWVERFAVAREQATVHPAAES